MLIPHSLFFELQNCISRCWWRRMGHFSTRSGSASMRSHMVLAASLRASDGFCRMRRSHLPLLEVLNGQDSVGSHMVLAASRCSLWN